MKILMLSWEYPPRNIGGLANHTYFLSCALADIGHEVHVVTCNAQSENYELMKGVHVHRVTPYELEDSDFPKWVMHLNFSMLEKCCSLINNDSFDVIHAHDWLVAYTARAVKNIYKLPMLCTLHSTEHGRNNGIWNDIQRYIHSVELLLVRDASKVIVCSSFMKEHAEKVLGVNTEKLAVIPNGIEIHPRLSEKEVSDFKNKTLKSDERLLFYIGRHVYEKGIQVLIHAMRFVLEKENNIKLIIAGAGPMTQELKELVASLGLRASIIFYGYLDEQEKQRLFAISDAAVFPSLFEPFGIVALEAMAEGCPVIVSDTGGFSEIVSHGFNGLKAITGSPQSLCDNILEIIQKPDLKKRITENALIDVSANYSWKQIGDNTVRLYEKIMQKG